MICHFTLRFSIRVCIAKLNYFGITSIYLGVYSTGSSRWLIFFHDNWLHYTWSSTNTVPCCWRDREKQNPWHTSTNTELLAVITIFSIWRAWRGFFIYMTTGPLSSLVTFLPQWELSFFYLLPHAPLAVCTEVLSSNSLCPEWQHLETYFSSRVAFWCNCIKCLFCKVSSKNVMFFCIFWRVELGSWKSSSKVWFRVDAFSIISMEKIYQSFNKSLKSGQH